MKIPFKEIHKVLEDPFFEVNRLEKNVIRQHILPVDKYGEAPRNIQFIDWTEEDDRDVIHSSSFDTEIGRLLLASTSKGVCFLGFVGNDEAATKADFMQRFPKQPIEEQVSEFHKLAVEYCNGNRELHIPLHMKGTAFQVGIWKQLVRIPEGRLSAYGALSPDTGSARAIGSAVGANPVSYIVPCHRVVRSDGSYKGYRWGTEIKKQLLAYELQ